MRRLPRLPASQTLGLLRQPVIFCAIALWCTVLLQAQSTWTGAVSSDWSAPGNWSTNSAPTSVDDVVIPVVAVFPTVTVGSGAACGSLTIASSAELVMAPLGALAVSGDVTVSGAVLGNGTLNLVGAGAATVSSASALPALDVDKAPGSAVSLQGSVVVAGSFVLREGVLSATSSVTMQLPASFVGGTLLSTGSYRFESSVAFNGTSVAAQPAITVLGDWESDASFQPSSGTVVFDGDSTLSGSPSFFNVTVDIGAPLVSIVRANVPTHIRGSLSIRGNARWNGNQVVSVDQDLDIDNGGTFDTMGNSHQFGRSLTIDGSVLGGGVFVCVGSSAGTIAASQPLPDLTVAKNGVSTLTLGGSSVIVVTGDLLLTSGILTVSRTTRVGGVSTFEGGSLTGNSTLDLDGDANFVGASVTLPPTITCSGDWTADSFYDPAGGTVTLDGTPGSSQTIDLSGASFGSQTNFYILNIAAGATVTAASELRIRNAMTVTGQFTADAPMDQDGNFTVSTNAVFDARGFEHTFAGSVFLNTSIQVDGTGVFLFDGSASASLQTPTSLDVTVPNVRIAKTAGASLSIAYRLTINGSLELVSGRLTGQWTTIVTGDALFHGGHLGSTQPSAYAIEVQGDVVCDGVVAVRPPDITVHGNWTSDNLFAPQGGSVICGGTTPQVLSSSSGPLRLAQLTVNVGATASTQEVLECTGLTVSGAFNTTASMDCDGSVTVGAQGALDAGSASHTIATNLTVSGNLLATGQFIFDGTGTSSISSTDALPKVLVAKSENERVTLGTLTIDGDLGLTGGHLRTTNQTVTVTGDASFDGGVLSYANLIVDGDVAFGGTQSSANVSSGTAHVNLICRGDFTGHAAFHPVAGTITIDDAAATLSGALNLHSLTVVTNAVVSVLDPVVLTGSLSLNGQMDLQASNQNLEVRGHTNFGNGGQLRLGNQTYRFGGNFTTALGSIVRDANTTIEFFGPTGASISHNINAPLPPVFVRKDGQAAVSTSGAIEIDGDLTLESGVLYVASAMEVTGDASFLFGALSGGNQGLLTVNGDVTFAGALGLTPPNMVVKGDWTADALFRPTVRTVTFDGSGSVQNLLGSEGRFYALLLDVGANVVSNAPMRCDHSLTIRSATLESNNAADFVVTGLLDSTGTLDVEQALRVGGNVDASGSLVVGGELEVVGDVTIPSGTVAIAGGRLGGSLLADGGFSSSAAVFFEGPNSETVRSAAALPTITIDKPAASVMTLSAGLEINGHLLLNEGTVAASGTTMVSGNAMFMGGSVSGSGTIDVAGDITFAGALAFTPPNLRCRGNFTTDFEFQPISGLVEFNSNQTQQVFGSDSRFHDMSINTVTTVTSAEDLNFSGDVVVDGLLVTSGQVDCEGDFTMNNGWDAGTGNHSFGRNLAMQGNLTNATGVFVLDGAATSRTVSSTQGLPALRVACSHTVNVNNLLIDGDVDLESGRLVVNGAVVVGGGFHVSSGELAGGGLLQIVDDFESAGGFTASPPTIEVAGNWIADSGWAPTTGLVRFVGSSPQSLSSAAGSLQFQAVEVANNAQVTTAVPVAIRSTLTVNGQLTTTAALDVESTVTTNTASDLVLGAATHRFAGSLNLGGSVQSTGVFEFDNETATAISVTSAVAVPSIRKTGAGTLTLNGGLVVQGNVESERGALRYGNAVTVTGNATFRGGDLDSGSVLDVAGNVAFLGATATSPGTIRCGGNWSSESNFTPPNGRVELTGNGTIASLTPNQSASFHFLDVLSGVRTVVGDIAVRGSSMLVQSPATLNVGPNASLAIERAAVTVNGELQLNGTGQLLLGDPATVTIEQIGKLRMLGASAAAPVRVDGLAGGNYGFRVRGFIAARDFEFFRPDEQGLVIESTATVDQTVAEGFRNGTFDFPRNAPNAVLLNIDPPTTPPVALNLQNLAFQNSEAAQNVFNVRVTQGTPVTILNATGSFAGAAFEDDPLGDRIEWTSGQLTILDSFQVVAGVGEASVTWATIDESTVTSFVLDRQRLTPAPEPFGNAIVVSTSGVPSVYQQTVGGLVAGVTYRFRLQERETPTSSLTTIATGEVTPFGGGAPAEVFDVGPASPFPTIQSGIDAAINSGEAAPIVRVAAGTYPAFTITGAPALGMRVVGNGSGPVFIDTAASLTPVTIQNVPFGRFVELADMQIGSTASPVTGVLVTGSVGTVVLDEVSVQAGAANAMVVEGSLAFVLQGPGTSVASQAGDGLVIDIASAATVSNSNFSSLVVRGNSVLTHAAINVTPTIEPGSTVTSFAGVMPHLAGERFQVLSQPLQFQFEGFPSSLWLLVISDGYSLPLALFEMPVLVDLASIVVTHTGVTDPVGVGTNSSYLPANGALIGLTRVFQAASVSQTTGALRLSNAHAITIVAGN